MKVIVISNCHKLNFVTVSKIKTAKQQPIEYPEPISFYRQKMEEVDRQTNLQGCTVMTENPTSDGKKI